MTTMTKEERIDHWFKEVDSIRAEYELLCNIIIEDLKNPVTPEIIKVYLADLNDRLDQAHCEYKKGR